MGSCVKTFIPKPLIFLFKYLIRIESDIDDFVFGKRNKLIPPRELRTLIGPFISARNYRRVGEE